jgi:hypothetical protein
METYILMAVVLVCFAGTTFGFRFLMDDPEMGMIVGAVAGLLIALVAGFGYFSYLSSCQVCV